MGWSYDYLLIDTYNINAIRDGAIKEDFKDYTIPFRKYTEFEEARGQMLADGQKDRKEHAYSEEELKEKSTKFMEEFLAPPTDPEVLKVYNREDLFPISFKIFKGKTIAILPYLFMQHVEVAILGLIAIAHGYEGEVVWVSGNSVTDSANIQRFYVGKGDKLKSLEAIPSEEGEYRKTLNREFFGVNLFDIHKFLMTNPEPSVLVLAMENAVVKREPKKKSTT